MSRRGGPSRDDDFDLNSLNFNPPNRGGGGGRPRLGGGSLSMSNDISEDSPFAPAAAKRNPPARFQQQGSMGGMNDSPFAPAAPKRNPPARFQQQGSMGGGDGLFEPAAPAKKPPARFQQKQAPPSNRSDDYDPPSRMQNKPMASKPAAAKPAAKPPARPQARPAPTSNYSNDLEPEPPKKKPPARLQRLAQETMDKETADRVECRYCGRNFASDRIDKHESVCGGSKKRPVFNAQKQRLQGTEQASYYRKGGPKETKKPNDMIGGEKKFVVEHRNLVRALRAARKMTAYEEAVAQGKAVGPPPKMPVLDEVPDDRVQCPYCGRKFGEEQFSRHQRTCTGDGSGFAKRTKPTALQSSGNRVIRGGGIGSRNGARPPNRK